MTDLREQARSHLATLGIASQDLQPIREKDGVVVARVRAGTGTAILKYFGKPEYRREIANYGILTQLGVPTMEVLGASDRALLLEDIDASPRWRLGTDRDMSDPVVAIRLATWYRGLHRAGREFVALGSSELYDEADVLTEASLHLIADATGTSHLPVWRVLLGNLEEIQRRIAGLPRTLTYNDFYWTNLIVAKDSSTAFMFDYNLLGKGYAYSDVRNVCSSLTPDAAETFRAAYGEISEFEIRADDVASTLVTLHFACGQDRFPRWAETELHTLRSGLLERVETFLGC